MSLVFALELSITIVGYWRVHDSLYVVWLVNKSPTKYYFRLDLTGL